MYLGKTLFAQAMDFLPWKTFHRIVNRYGGDHRTRSLSCAEQFRVMAFAQLTYRESLRDIEVCLAAQAGKLYHMGIGAAVARSTLADANESRDWRIYFELAQRLITNIMACSGEPTENNAVNLTRIRQIDIVCEIAQLGFWSMGRRLVSPGGGLWPGLETG